ncbi:hypothetical protein ET495_15530 [Xylanimonas allomyrinae]|uniref:Uncharacterized protein n=1 Tax=Xylanimonas allomyrinae TaxID=2509459 RepID=A0A4P6EV84_9MICO|nr:hypothetical protein [Xylanimonas allomyrinae]QAY64387.1 hypothetical protein ET495_15530 [Xylanimonas allomyrinae]
MTVRQVVRSAGVVLAYAAMGLACLVLVGVLADRGAALTALLAARAVLVTAGLVAIGVVTARGRGTGAHTLLAVLGYAACPAAWVGRAFLSQLWFAPGPATVALDAVAWLAVVLAARVVVTRTRA